jgi:hypothetical protein
MLNGPELPNYVTYIIEWFNEVGPALSGGFGPTPLTFTELKAWSALRGIVLTPWDASALRALSTVYCNIQNKKEP